MKIASDKDMRSKIEEVYRQCLVEMDSTRTATSKGTCKAGLHVCGKFGTEVWRSKTWTDQDKDTVIEKLGHQEYDETIKCLRTKVNRVVLEQHKKRTRVVTDSETEKPGSSASSPGPGTRNTSKPGVRVRGSRGRRSSRSSRSAPTKAKKSHDVTLQ